MTPEQYLKSKLNVQIYKIGYEFGPYFAGVLKADLESGSVEVEGLFSQPDLAISYAQKINQSLQADGDYAYKKDFFPQIIYCACYLDGRLAYPQAQSSNLPEVA